MPKYSQNFHFLIILIFNIFPIVLQNFPESCTFALAGLIPNPDLVTIPRSTSYLNSSL